MILNIRHVGIVVTDLERMKTFYGSLGFVKDSSDIEEGTFIDQVTGLDKVKLEWIKMKLPDNSLLELLKYHSHSLENDQIKQYSNRLGCSHIAFTVEDIDKICDQVILAGGSVVNSPIKSPNGKVKVAYCHDPEGVLLEIVQELSKA